MLNNSDELQLQTLEWFSESKCDEEQISVLNSYDLNDQQWIEPLHITEKFKNFFGCKLKVASSIFKLSFLDEGLKYNFGTQNPMIQKILPQRAAFEENFSQVFGQRGNYTIEFVKEDAPIVHIFHYTTIFRDTELKHFTSAFFQEQYTFAIPPPEIYSGYEKFLIPFDIYTWFGIITTFIIAFCMILMINRMSIAMQEIVYGENNNEATLNILRIFFGVSQTKLPWHNFGRVLLVLFSYFCLIIRTSYQGMI